MKKITLNLILIILVFASCKKVEIRDDFKTYYDKYKVEGSFILFDNQNNKYIVYNQDQTKEQFTPASTFKICNSLIALETAVVKNQNVVFKWDSVERSVLEWNQDQNMKTAFRYSTVWYYQTLARKVGGENMKLWLDKAEYGNADTSGGIDKFWLSGGLKITPEEQIEFLRNLYENKLPFSQQNVDIVKDMMFTKDTLNCKFYGKTGWGNQDKKDIGWFVGYMETSDNVYFFVNCIQSADNNNNSFSIARREIVYQIFSDLELIK